jgi:hypothetical protein
MGNAEVESLGILLFREHRKLQSSTNLSTRSKHVTVEPATVLYINTFTFNDIYVSKIVEYVAQSE